MKRAEKIITLAVTFIIVTLCSAVAAFAVPQTQSPTYYTYEQPQTQQQTTAYVPPQTAAPTQAPTQPVQKTEPYYNYTQPVTQYTEPYYVQSQTQKQAAVKTTEAETAPTEAAGISLVESGNVFLGIILWVIILVGTIFFFVVLSAAPKDRIK